MKTTMPIWPTSIFLVIGSSIHLALIWHNAIDIRGDGAFPDIMLFLFTVVPYGILFLTFFSKNISQLPILFCAIILPVVEIYSYFSNPSMNSRSWLLVLMPYMMLLPIVLVSIGLAFYLGKKGDS